MSKFVLYLVAMSTLSICSTHIFLSIICASSDALSPLVYTILQSSVPLPVLVNLSIQSAQQEACSRRLTNNTTVSCLSVCLYSVYLYTYMYMWECLCHCATLYFCLSVLCILHCGHCTKGLILRDPRQVL